MANDTGGFSDVTKAVTVFGGNAIEPLQAQFLSLNEWDSREAVRFRSYQLPTNEGN
ncbi:bacteriophage capsid portal protein [Herbaspirillum sp. GW103]|uniref:bacteriophage capsid portal protein n=1 Tax=Herbaspirillum sp. GW103 TaxID=1175306 RepID=UPI00025E49C4|nr:bacteriophage capsid portal protein [Herbaspirillum sp. GW103]EIJ46758.1 bacteriophage capsid portal protein [Herbaspirillum sp. GW103]